MKFRFSKFYLLANICSVRIEASMKQKTSSITAKKCEKKWEFFLEKYEKVSQIGMSSQYVCSKISIQYESTTHSNSGTY